MSKLSWRLSRTKIKTTKHILTERNQDVSPLPQMISQRFWATSSISYSSIFISTICIQVKPSVDYFYSSTSVIIFHARSSDQCNYILVGEMWYDCRHVITLGNNTYHWLGIVIARQGVFFNLCWRCLLESFCYDWDGKLSIICYL